MSQSDSRLEKRFIDAGAKFHALPNRGNILRKSARVGAAYRALQRKGWTEAKIDEVFTRMLLAANRPDIAEWMEAIR